MYMTIFKVDPNEYDLEIVKTAFESISKKDKTFKYAITPTGKIVIFSRSKELAIKRGEWAKKTVLVGARYEIKNWR